MEEPPVERRLMEERPVVGHGGGQDAWLRRRRRRRRRRRTPALCVLRQEGHPGEGLPAGAARVLFDVGMSLQMGPEVGPVCEGSGAVRTREGLLSSVRADVALEQPRPGERLTAEFALAGQRVSPDVHLQCAQRKVHLQQKSNISFSQQININNKTYSNPQSSETPTNFSRHSTITNLIRTS